jgi:hypothetical protein
VSALTQIAPARALKNLPSLYVAEVKKPLFAFVGAADLALEQAKEVPASVKTLRGDVEERVEQVTGRASEVYGALSVRGERLLTSIRRQPATAAAVAEGKEAVRKAEAAAVAARASAHAGGKAVSDAATTLG